METKRNQSTVTTKRCTIQDHTTPDGNRRWLVTWTPDKNLPPVRIICASKHAAHTLAEVLDAPGVLWAC